MNIKKLIPLLFITAALLICAACGADGTATEDGAAISFTDMTGKTVNMDSPASSVVVLTAADCEIICALGCGDRLIGRGEYCDYPAEIASVPQVQSGYETNLEQIIALDPDVLLMSTMDQTPEQVASLESAGIIVVQSNADDIAGTYESIRMTGAMLGKDAEAEQLIRQMQDDFARVAAVAAEVEEKTVYFEVSPLEYGLWAAGADTFMNEIAEMLGITNIFADVSGWAEVSEEQVISRDPDIIISVGMSFGDVSPEDEIRTRAGWQNISAVKNGMILNLAHDELTRPGPRLALGAQMLCDFIYGTDIAAD